MKFSTTAIKEIGSKILNSRWFWYVIIIFFGYKLLQKAFPTLFKNNPDFVKLPKGEESPKATQIWWNTVGQPATNKLYDSLKNEWFRSTERAKAIQTLLTFDKHQLTLIYNEFNRKYSAEFKQRSMTKVIDDQYIFWLGVNAQQVIKDRLISFNLV
jgi:hypothetical protein